MLTKEECNEALKVIISRGGGVEELLYWTYAMPDAINTLNNLIDEHFDNPPLKFEEIKENDFIFDKKTKERAKVRETRNTDGEKYIIFFQGYRCWDFYIKKYEPNRFYRKEVQE